jgi:universal stress protein A
MLVLVDLSAASEQVAAAARELSELHGAELVVLHVAEFVPVEPMGESIMPTVEFEDELFQRARVNLTEFVARTGLGDARTRVGSGNIKAEVLAVAAQEKPDLIVLGSRERHGLAILVNLTEDTVLHAAHCDVLSIRIKQ